MADPRSGGALRQRVTTALAMPLDSVMRAGEMRRVVLTSGERDVGRLIAQLDAAAKTLGHDIELSLRLEGQLDAAGLEPLREQGRKLKLGYIADPCADLAQACAAFAHGAPPLAISAHRHDPQALARAMRDGGVQVLLVRPDAARMWSVAADVTGIELAVIGDTSLASELRAATQPVIVQSPTPDATYPPSKTNRITRITLHRVKVPMRQLYVSALYMRRTTERIVVELETADGQRGFGETNGTDEVLAIVQRMAQKLLGQDPLDRLRLRQLIAGPTVGSRNGLAEWAALAGLDMALFDWAGRHHDVPIWQLLGGSGARRDFEAVAHIPALLLDEPIDRSELPRRFADPATVHHIVEHALDLHRDTGFTAFKMKCTGTSPDWDVRILTALREALGPEVKLRWDPNASYPPAQATVLCQQLEHLNLEYYEDPIHGIPGMAQLRRRMKTPLATNMCVVTFDHLVHFLHQPCVDVVLADLVMWGGIQGMAELGAVAPLFGFDMTIHSAFECGLGMAANLQVAAALDPVRRAIDFGLENMVNELIIPHIPVRNGRVAVPDGPGLGVQPNWSEINQLKMDTTVVTV
jgi:glucarate dehydratase